MQQDQDPTDVSNLSPDMRKKIVDHIPMNEPKRTAFRDSEIYRNTMGATKFVKKPKKSRNHEQTVVRPTRRTHQDMVEDVHSFQVIRGTFQRGLKPNFRAYTGDGLDVNKMSNFWLGNRKRSTGL